MAIFKISFCANPLTQLCLRSSKTVNRVLVTFQEVYFVFRKCMDNFLSSLDHKFLADFPAEEKLPALTLLLQWSLSFLERAYTQPKSLDQLKLFLGQKSSENEKVIF